ncbi:MAG: metalloregulator ArsR/SmtB family transcription factor [Candidatus Thermoplasmatota archaeon]
MEEDQIYSIHADACKMFSHEVRLKIIDLLRDGEKSVTELAENTDLTQPNVSQHLAKMRDRNFVKTRKEGTQIYYSIANDKIFEAFELMREIIKEQMVDPSAL